MKRLRQRVTLKDVAAAAGVHPATVSRALNPAEAGRLNPNTAYRLAAVAAEMGFQPNLLGRSLRQRATRSVGLLVPDISNPLTPALVSGVEDVLQQRGYALLLASTGNDNAREQAHLEALLARGVDGLVIASSHPTQTGRDHLRDLDVPVVLLMRRPIDSSLACVVADERTGMSEAVNHLVALGHRRIAYISAPLQVASNVAERLTAFENATKANGIAPVDRPIVVCRGYGVSDGAAALEGLLEGTPVTAVVASNDLLALGCYQTMQAAGMRCPDDLSVVGHYDMPLAPYLSPPLTTIHTPFDEMGHAAAEMLLRTMDGTDNAAEVAPVPTHFIIRASTGPPSA